MVGPWTANRPAKVCKPVGCLECRMTGYLGRVGIYETLVFTGAIKALTAKSAELTAVREQAMKEGMKPLRISGAMKVAAGVTTIHEEPKAEHGRAGGHVADRRRGLARFGGCGDPGAHVRVAAASQWL